MVPTPGPLKYEAAGLPGGLETMILLGWLSEDDRVRAIAGRWSSLPRTIRPQVELEELCREIGLDRAVFGHNITMTAFDLGIDVSALLGRVASYPSVIRGVFTTPGLHLEALRLTGILAPRLQFVPREESTIVTATGLRGPSKHDSRGSRARSLESNQACGRMARARWRWGLSQGQFARLFMTSVRTVRRWEDRQFAPTPHQQWFLGLFEKYIAKEGLAAFLSRFVRQTSRYQAAGPVARSARGAHSRFPGVGGDHAVACPSTRDDEPLGEQVELCGVGFLQRLKPDDEPHLRSTAVAHSPHHLR